MFLSQNYTLSATREGGDYRGQRIQIFHKRKATTNESCGFIMYSFLIFFLSLLAASLGQMDIKSVGQHSWHEISTGEMGLRIPHLDANYANCQQIDSADQLRRAWWNGTRQCSISKQIVTAHLHISQYAV